MIGYSAGGGGRVGLLIQFEAYLYYPDFPRSFWLATLHAWNFLQELLLL